jgi:lipoprotein-anchoring transpeptidase ErfK/SrfK
MRMRRTVAALAMLVVALLTLIWATRATWQPAPLKLPKRIATADTSPRLQIDVGRGRLPSLDDATVSIDGQVLDARLTIAGRVLNVQIPALDEGEHTVRISIPGTFAQPRARSQQTTLDIDTTPPLSTLRVKQGAASGTRAPIVASVVTEDGAAASIVAPVQRVVNLDSGRGSATLTLSEGRHRITIETRDAVGNLERLSRSISVDATPPVIGDPGIASTLNTNMPRFVVPVRDNGPAASLSAAASIDGRSVIATVSNGAVHIRSRQALSEGEHDLRVAVTDGGGNDAERTESFVVDSTEALGAATIRTGARGEDVKRLQRELARPGAWTSEPPQLEITGIYDGATKSAVERFQSEQALDVDGVAGPFTIAALTLRITIDQSTHKLILFRYGKVFRTYRIAVGQPKYPTPNGVFRIVDKQKNPTWTPPDSEWAKDAKVTPPGPDNPLGTRWMGLDEPSIGIHGTNDPESLGYSVSHGCVRMAMADVEELFDLVAEGTQVEIRP